MMNKIKTISLQMEFICNSLPTIYMHIVRNKFENNETKLKHRQLFAQKCSILNLKTMRVKIIQIMSECLQILNPTSESPCQHRSYYAFCGEPMSQFKQAHLQTFRRFLHANKAFDSILSGCRYTLLRNDSHLVGLLIWLLFNI